MDQCTEACDGNVATGYNLALKGANAFLELSTPERQAKQIEQTNQRALDAFGEKMQTAFAEKLAANAVNKPAVSESRAKRLNKSTALLTDEELKEVSEPEDEDAESTSTVEAVKPKKSLVPKPAARTLIICCMCCICIC